MNDNKHKILYGLAWTTVERAVSLFVQFIITILIARLLSPAEFGVLGLLVVFIEISQVFIDGGMGDALVYRNRLCDKDLQTTFTFNICISALLVTILFFISPYLGIFFNQPQLHTYIRLCLIVIIVNSLIVVPTAILKIKLNFRLIAISNFVAIFVSGIAGVVAAYKGLGVYSLIIQVITRSVIQCVILFPCSFWLPKLRFYKKSLYEMLRYGLNLLGANLLTRIVEQSTVFFIGKAFKSSELGLFTRGQSFAYIPSNVLMMVGSTVFFPTLSSLNKDMHHLLTTYKKTIVLLSIFYLPVVFWIASVSSPLVYVLLTDKWMEIVPIIQILAVSKVLFPLANVSEQCLNAMGRSDLFLKQQIIKITVKAVLIFAVLQINLFAVVLAEGIYNLSAFIITNVVGNKVLFYPLKKQIKDILPVFLSALVSALAGYLATKILASPILQIMVSFVVCAVVYIILLKAIGKLSEVRTITRLVAKRA